MNTPQLRIGIVAASLDILGGQGVQAHSLIDALSRDGYPVTLIPINPRFPRGLRWVRQVKFLRTVLNLALYLPSLIRLASVDVVHVFSASYVSFLLGPAPAITVARLLRKRVVLHYHSGEADDHLAHWGGLVHPWLRLSDVIVVPSEYLAGIFAGHGYQTRVIHNVVDLSRFEFRDRAPLKPRLLSTRNLEPSYRVDVILQAFAILKTHAPDATLTIAGFGSEEPRLRRLAVDGVRFIGKVEPGSMPNVCASADIFLNASVIDNQPVSILEAFASGLPVVSTPTGDIPAMVLHNHTGLLVAPDDPASLASAVLRLIKEPREAFRMAQRARQEVTNYAWPAVRDEWASVYTGAQKPWTSQPTH